LGFCDKGQCKDGRLSAADRAAGLSSEPGNRNNWVNDFAKGLWEAVPKNRCEWSKYLSTQDTYFTTAGYAASVFPLTAPTAPILVGVGAAAGVAANSLSGNAAVAAVDLAIDAVGSKLPGGTLKDIGLDAVKKVSGDPELPVNKKYNTCK
jgi:hypothetical protein